MSSDTFNDSINTLSVSKTNVSSSTDLNAKFDQSMSLQGQVAFIGNIPVVHEFKPQIIQGHLVASPADPKIIHSSIREVCSLYELSQYVDFAVSIKQEDREYCRDREIPMIHEGARSYAIVKNIPVKRIFLSDGADKKTDQQIIAFINKATDSQPAISHGILGLLTAVSADLNAVKALFHNHKIDLGQYITTFANLAKQVDTGFQNASQVYAMRRLQRDRNFISSHFLGCRRQETSKGIAYNAANILSYTSYDQLPREIKFTQDELVDFYTNPAYNDAMLCQKIGAHMILLSLSHRQGLLNFWTAFGAYLMTAGCGLKPALQLYHYRLLDNDTKLFPFNNQMYIDAFYIPMDDNDRSGLKVFSLRSTILNGAKSSFLARFGTRAERVEKYDRVENDVSSYF